MSCNGYDDVEMEDSTLNGMDDVTILPDILVGDQKSHATAPIETPNIPQESAAQDDVKMSDEFSDWLEDGPFPSATPAGSTSLPSNDDQTSAPTISPHATAPPIATLSFAAPPAPIVSESSDFTRPDTNLTLPRSLTQAESEAILARSKELMARLKETSQGHPMHSLPAPNLNGEGSSKTSNTSPVEPSLMQTESNADNAWMDEEAETDDRYDYYNSILEKLSQREARFGKLTPQDAMEKMKAEGKLQTLQRLKNGREGNPVSPEDEEDSLFIPESNHERRDTVINRHRQAMPARSDQLLVNDEDGDDAQFGGAPQTSSGAFDLNFADVLQQAVQGGVGALQPLDQDLGVTKNGDPRKRRAKVAKSARDVFAKNNAKNLEKEAKKQEKQRVKAAKQEQKANAAAAKALTKSKGKGKAKGKGPAKKANGPIKNGQSLLQQKGTSWARSGEDELANVILSSLQTDDIEARRNNPAFDCDPEPQIRGKLAKETQFQKLFASVPEGSDRVSIKDDKRQLKQAAQAFGYGKVTAENGQWRIKGLSSTVYHHQLLGAQWMVERELSSQAPHGGILADSMGLGKTIQTLALMVANPPLEEDIKRKVRATLIVCPAAIVQQWVEEIQKHTEKGVFGKVVAYRAASRLTREVLQDLDIVVTSYHEIMKAFPYPTKEDRQRIATVGLAQWWQDAIKTIGIIHQVNWYRVVLDEAQSIKNNSSRTSLACQNLHSVYRWCLTGTPLMNRLEELFPYLRFLKADYTMDWKTFQKYFCDPETPECIVRINTLLSYCMIRRTMSHTILGRPIITLPMPHPRIEHVEFSPAEKIIYRITENRFRSNLNRFFEKGDAARNYGVFMVQLLRLRQITSHPWLIERTMRECWTIEDIFELRSRLANIEERFRGPYYEQTKIWMRETETRVANQDELEPLPFGQSDFGYTFKIDHAFKTFNEREIMQRITCGMCLDIPEAPVKTDCEHIFCKECLESRMHAGEADKDVLGFFICPTCEKMFKNFSNVVVQPNDNSYAYDMDEELDRTSRKRCDLNSKGLDMMGFEPASDSTWLLKSDGKDFPLTTSIKTAKLKGILLRDFHEAPLDKVVVYVQFRTLARIVGRICKSEGWGFLYLTGDTSQEHRYQAIKRFREDPDAKVLVAGLKCGGVGLNFPWANRVVSLDLWWNHAIEQQAFGRIFRIGQQKETYMTRIVVKQSVDMRLLTVQGHKLKNIAKTISDDGSEVEKPNLSLKQLANLFGFLRTDADDNIISIEADYDDMDEWVQGGAGRIEIESES